MMLRNATIEDMPSLVNMGAAAYQEAGYEAIAPFCGESMGRMAKQCIDAGVAVVAVDGDELKGVIGLVITPYPLNNAFKAAYEVLLWVHPEVRKTKIGFQLVEESEIQCRELGVNSQHLAHMGIRAGDAQKLYELNGFVLSEICYTKVM